MLNYVFLHYCARIMYVPICTYIYFEVSCELRCDEKYFSNLTTIYALVIIF